MSCELWGTGKSLRDTTMDFQSPGERGMSCEQLDSLFLMVIIFLVLSIPW